MDDLEVLADLDGIQPPITYESLRKDVYRAFVDEYLIDLDARAAGKRCGFRSPATAHTLMRRDDVRQVIEQRLAARSYRLAISADDVLRGLWAQYQRLLGMLDVDIQDIVSRGALKEVEEWPEPWRRGMMQELRIEPRSERSGDGVQAGESKSWDQVGTRVVIKRADVLRIEREIRETLIAIGNHVRVKAFPVAGEKLGESVEHLAESIDAAIAEGRRRAARQIS